MDEAVDEAQRRGREGRAERLARPRRAVRPGGLRRRAPHARLPRPAAGLGGGDANASTQGALRTLVRQPGGTTLVWAIALGMALLVVWRLLEAGFGHRREEGGTRVRKRLVSLGKGAVYAALGVSAVKVVTHARSGSGRGTVAQVLTWPGGPVLVVLAGLAVVAYAATVAWSGWRRSSPSTWRPRVSWAPRARPSWCSAGSATSQGRRPGDRRRPGRVGRRTPVAAGGRRARPGPAEGAPAAVRPVLITLIGIGLACYGLFCFARARYLDR